MKNDLLEPWGVEQTETTNWIGPMRKDGSGKVREIVCSTDREGLKPEILQKNDDLARMIAALPEIIITAQVAKCGCSTDGHDEKCWFPALQAALNKANSQMTNFESALKCAEFVYSKEPQALECIEYIRSMMDLIDRENNYVASKPEVSDVR